ncbi:hypothetical protein BB560_002793 [Smittium megazygosporum]|uniref:ABC1 atypical kinase-like domain-containing protein n=1 Tax=Smittium megazygosporum TaxID=133381 RepID=A0A2T9ZDX7_9FUNG|nr:hypothetical protein BB560_002793 [Smittium megazygosporum]
MFKVLHSSKTKTFKNLFSLDARFVSETPLFKSRACFKSPVEYSNISKKSTFNNPSPFTRRFYCPGSFTYKTHRIYPQTVNKRCLFSSSQISNKGSGSKRSSNSNRYSSTAGNCFLLATGSVALYITFSKKDSILESDLVNKLRSLIRYFARFNFAPKTLQCASNSEASPPPSPLDHLLIEPLDQSEKRSFLIDMLKKQLDFLLSAKRAIFFALNEHLIEPIKTMTRFFYLLALFSPVFVTVPILFACDFIFPNENGSNSKCWQLWYSLVSNQMSLAGPAFIKLSQWAATRTDIFSLEFCDELSKFHSRNKPHSFAFTLKSIQDTLTLDIDTVFEWIEQTPLGVGAIAQVHKAKLRQEFVDDLLEKSQKYLENETSENGSKKRSNSSRPRLVGNESSVDYTIEYINSIFPLLISKKPNCRIKPDFWDAERFAKLSQFLSCNQTVVLKILHPRVEKLMNRDLRILSFFAKLASYIPTLKWLSLDEEVKIFGDLMKSQLDLRIEAANMVLFDKNFKDRNSVDFPIPIVQLSSKNVLVETIVDGIPLNIFLESLPNSFGPEMAKIGLNSFMRMLISDNFVHSDLHPGNIVVNFSPPQPLPWPLKTFLKLVYFKQLVDYKLGKIPERPKLVVDEFGIGADKMPSEKQVSETVLQLYKNHQNVTDYINKLFAAGYKPRMTYLDSGLVTVLNKVSRRNFLDLFEAVCSFDGYRAGSLMVTRSRTPELVLNADEFSLEIQDIVTEVKKSSLSLSQVTASQILGRALNSSRVFHVRVDPSFVNVAVAILILEGIGRQMDENLDLLNTSLPILREVMRFEAQQSLDPRNISLSENQKTFATIDDMNGESIMVSTETFSDEKDIQLKPGSDDSDELESKAIEFSHKVGVLKFWAYVEFKHYIDSVSTWLYDENFEIFGQFSPFVEFISY